MPANQIILDAATTDLVLVSGPVSKPQESVQEITRPGVDGVAYRQEGKRGARFQLRCIVDTAAVSTLLDTIKGFRGQIVNIYDEFSMSHTNILIESVSPPDVKRAVTLNGFLADGSSTHIVRFTLSCLDTKIA